MPLICYSNKYSLDTDEGFFDFLVFFICVFLYVCRNSLEIHIGTGYSRFCTFEQTAFTLMFNSVESEWSKVLFCPSTKYLQLEIFSEKATMYTYLVMLSYLSFQNIWSKSIIFIFHTLSCLWKKCTYLKTLAEQLSIPRNQITTSLIVYK
jgi:hypothetical protein